LQFLTTATRCSKTAPKLHRIDTVQHYIFTRVVTLW